MKFSQPHYHFSLANGLAAVGRTKEAIETINQAVRLCNTSFDRVFEAEIYRLRGDIFLEEGSTNAISKANADYQHAETLAEQQGARMWQLRTLLAMEEIAQTEQQQKFVTAKINEVCLAIPEDLTEPHIASIRSIFGLMHAKKAPEAV